MMVLMDITAHSPNSSSTKRPNPALKPLNENKSNARRPGLGLRLAPGLGLALWLWLRRGSRDAMAEGLEL